MDLHLGKRGRSIGAAMVVALAAISSNASGGAPRPGSPEASSAVRGGGARSLGPASVVLGQVRFDEASAAGTAATLIPLPVGNPAVSADGRLFVASGGGGVEARLLAFDRYAATSGPGAALTIDLPFLSGVSMQGPRLAVTAGHEVHIFDAAPAGKAAAPDVSGGTPLPGCSATTFRQPQSAFLTQKGQLIVADSWNHRVLVWHSLPKTGPLGAADLVLGQRRTDTCVANDADGDGASNAAAAATLFHPTSVWSDGVRLVVADQGNHRVLMWDAFPASDPATHRPNRVLGQSDFTGAAPNAGRDAPSAASLASPAAVAVSATGELAVADADNHRVLIWRSLPTRDAQPADQVVGQPDFARSRLDVARGASTLNYPSGVHFDGRHLIVNDKGNSRVLVWRAAD